MVDLGGHFDVTGRARATTLGCTVSWVLPRVHSLSALPLDFFGRLRLLGTLHVPAAVHGAEAAVVFQEALRKLRVAFVRAVWSDGLNLASPGAVLNLLDRPVGCDLGIMWHGVGFGCCVGTWRITQRFMSAAESMGCFGSSLPVRLILSHSSSALKCCLFRGSWLPGYVPGSGLDCLIFVRFPVLSSTSSLRSRRHKFKGMVFWVATFLT